MASANTSQTADVDQTTLSKEYSTPLGLPHTTITALKARIKQHYDLASTYYHSLWGEHIHHGYWPTPESAATESKEVAQVNLIHLLLRTAGLSSPPPEAEGNTAGPPLQVLDVGCGLGGTSRFLARELGAHVTGITISSAQVELATNLSLKEKVPGSDDGKDGLVRVGKGTVRFLELDAEKMGEHFLEGSEFDVVWISEALSHFPDKALFFKNAFAVLKPGGSLVLADWFRDGDLAGGVFERDIKPIEDGMLLPPLCTQEKYVEMATAAGLKVLGGPKDISKQVSKTWDISWSLVQSPSLWAFAFSQGRDGIAFLQSFLAMRRGYANGSFRYAVMAFQKE